MRDRGLEKTNLVISDDHPHIQSAVEQSFPGYRRQMCHVRFIQAVMTKVPRKHYKKVARLLKEALSDPRRFQECALELESRGYPKAGDTMDQIIHGLLNYRSAP